MFLAEGFLHLSVEDLAVRLKCSKSTLYAVAPSKEQLVVAVVRGFFRRAAERLDAQLEPIVDPEQRLRVYLHGIAVELAPASRQFHADLEAFAPTRELYARNSEWAAANVRAMVRAAARPDRPVDAVFLGGVAALVIDGIQRGRLRVLTDLDDAEAYEGLADLLLSGLAGAPRSGD